jgi:hypothetical protein
MHVDVRVYAECWGGNPAPSFLTSPRSIVTPNHDKHLACQYLSSHCLIIGRLECRCALKHPQL